MEYKPDKNMEEAIKLVYASIFSNDARIYFEAINFRIDDEKMAIVIQEVVGNSFNGSLELEGKS